MNEFEELDNLVQKILNMSEKDIQKNYKNTLEDLRTTIRKQYDKYEKNGKLDMKEMSKYDRLKKFDEEVKDRLSNLYKDNNSLIKATLTNICDTTRDVVIDTAEKKTKKSLMAIKKNLDVEKTVNEEMAGLKWADRTAHHRSEVIYQIQKTLKEGLSQGSTYKEMSDRLTEKLNKDVVQPMRIIRTEGARVHASTQMQAFDKMAEKGLKMTKKWVTAKDERVRDMHRQMNGVIVPYEEDFTLPDGTKTKMPHLSGVAKHDIHCRCIVTIDFAKNIDDSNKVRNVENKTPKQEEKYTQRQVDNATEWYVSGDGQWINQYLRGNSDIIPTKQELELIDAIKQGTNSEIVKEDVLYRSVDAKAIFGNMTDMEYEQLKSALVYNADDKFSLATKEKFLKDINKKEIIEKGFMSTTKSQEVALEWGGFTGSDKPVVLELKVPRGIRGRDLERFDIYGDKQFEVLLSPNQKYVINEVTTKQGAIYVKASIIPDDTVINFNKIISEDTKKVTALKSTLNTKKVFENIEKIAEKTVKTNDNVVNYIQPQYNYLDKDKAIKIISKDAKKWEKNLFPMEKESVRQYTKNTFKDINNYLRGKPSAKYSPEHLQEIVDNIDKAISKFDLKEDISVIRGISTVTLKKKMGFKKIENIVGKTYTSKGFESSTFDINIAHKFSGSAKFDDGGERLYIQFDIPKGKGHGAYVDLISENKGESEFLINRNTSFEFYEKTEINGITLLKARLKK